MSENEEIAKWLNLGYETYGPAGLRAVARAVGLKTASFAPDTTRDRRNSWTTISSSDIPGAYDTDDVAANDKVVEPPQLQARAVCPKSPPRNTTGWKPYVGDPAIFHCGFEGYLEDRGPSSESPIAECFYDGQGRLVDDAHPYGGCKGTPDSYAAGDPRHWTWNDPGGIWNQGFGGFAESRRHANDLARDAMRRRDFAPYSIGPFRAPLPP